jgi:hypothetical protein
MGGSSKNGQKTAEQHDADRKAAQQRKKRHGGTKPEARLSHATPNATMPSRRLPHKVTSVAPKKPVKDVVAERLGKAILADKQRDGWKHEHCVIAVSYVHHLVYGKPIATAELEALPTEIRQLIERKFAITCWFSRGIVKKVRLAGMSYDWFDQAYQQAQHHFPATAVKAA